MTSDNTDFNLVTTDSGLCQVLNGNTMRETYMGTSRMRELWSALEASKIEPSSEMIQGAGKSYQKVFWLDLGDKYVIKYTHCTYRYVLNSLRYEPFFGKSRSARRLDYTKRWAQGSGTLSINEWLKFFSVRTNPIDLVGGTSYAIKIKPVHHTSSPRIRDISAQGRRCLFPNEKEQGAVSVT